MKLARLPSIADHCNGGFKVEKGAKFAVYKSSYK